jgi:hypothetical protein
MPEGATLSGRLAPPMWQKCNKNIPPLSITAQQACLSLRQLPNLRQIIPTVSLD